MATVSIIHNSPKTKREIIAKADGVNLLGDE